MLCLSVISCRLDNEEAMAVEPWGGGGGVNRSAREQKLDRNDILTFCFHLTENSVSLSYKELPNRKVVRNT